VLSGNIATTHDNMQHASEYHKCCMLRVVTIYSRSACYTVLFIKLVIISDMNTESEKLN